MKRLIKKASVKTPSLRYEHLDINGDNLIIIYDDSYNIGMLQFKVDEELELLDINTLDIKRNYKNDQTIEYLFNCFMDIYNNKYNGYFVLLLNVNNNISNKFEEYIPSSILIDDVDEWSVSMAKSFLKRKKITVGDNNE